MRLTGVVFFRPSKHPRISSCVCVPQPFNSYTINLKKEVVWACLAQLRHKAETARKQAAREVEEQEDVRGGPSGW